MRESKSLSSVRGNSITILELECDETPSISVTRINLKEAGNAKTKKLYTNLIQMKSHPKNTQLITKINQTQ